jgi:hypothetical protein
MSLPLSDLVPLRTTAVWPLFAKPEPLPVVYGSCTVGAVQYDQTRKFWLVADHAIDGIDAVYIDDKATKAYAWRNAADPTGHPVALVELGAPLKNNEVLTAHVRGRLDSNTGALLENPADVTRDILALAGWAVSGADLAAFRAACGAITVAGVLSSNLTIRAQIQELADSIGMLWSFSLPGFATRWPVAAKPTGDPLYAVLVETEIDDLQSECRQDGLYTRLRIEYDWDWAKDRARRTVALEAATAAIYGARETTLQAKWLTSAATATARGVTWLEAHARPRWTVEFDLDFEPAIPPGGWFSVTHSLLPVQGNYLALESEWDWSNQRQRVKAEISAGDVPAVMVVAVGELFEDVASTLRVSYANGVATLTIVDDNGAPIQGAVVTLGSEERITDRAGIVRFTVARGQHQITVEAAGYVTQTMEITL